MKYNGLTAGNRVLCNGYFGTVKTLLAYTENMIEVRLNSGLVAVDAFDVINLQASTIPLKHLAILWKLLGDIPTFPDGDQVDCIEDSFGIFPAGTHREEIWRWFELKNPAFSVGEVMNNSKILEQM